MSHVLPIASASLVVAMLVLPGCSTQGGSNAGSGGLAAGGGSGSGGQVTGSGGSGDVARGGTVGSGGGSGSGETAGAGSGGVSPSSGGGIGRAGAPGTGGAASGGATSAGGTTSTKAGSGGMTSSGGTTRTSGRTGAGGASRGGSGGTSGATGGSTVVAGDDFVSDVKITVDANTKTILVVTWTQLRTADSTLLDFSFSGGSSMKSRAQPGAAGAHRDVVLGVPEKTDVTLRIVSTLGGIDYKTKDYKGTTGALPSGLPKPTFVSYNASLASPESWLLGAVEDSEGGCADLMSCYYSGLMWIWIMDRQARIVWYWADPSSNLSSSYPRVARDGEYIVIDRAKAGMTHSGATGVVRMTLDRQYYQTVAIDGIDDAIDVTPDGSILYDTTGDLREYTKQGTNRLIWSCSKSIPGGTGMLACYSNTVNWVPADDTVLLSFPYIDTVAQVDRKTGTLVGQYGNASGSYAFSPSPWKFQFPHSPTITPDGTLLVSTHLPDYPDGSKAGPKQHAFEEFEIDRANKKLVKKWSYGEGAEWAGFKGFNRRLANGNTLVNYGSGGVIREVTPDGKTVYEVKFDVATGDDYYNKMVGDTLLVSDLYALNGGGPK